MYLELVEQGNDRHLRCRECEEQICDVDDEYDDWRNHVPVRESEVADRMVDDFDMWVKRRDEEDKAVMLEYYCPGCAVQLHSQTTLDTEKRPLQVTPNFL
jgi:hypothetical protein